MSPPLTSLPNAISRRYNPNRPHGLRPNIRSPVPAAPVVDVQLVFQGDVLFMDEHGDTDGHGIEERFREGRGLLRGEELGFVCGKEVGEGGREGYG